MRLRDLVIVDKLSAISKEKPAVPGAMSSNMTHIVNADAGATKPYELCRVQYSV